MGGQDFANDTYVDGLPVTNSVVQGEGRRLSLGFSVEAIDQFQVETSGTAVMYNGQGASNYVVKSGTNTFRGSAFEAGEIKNPQEFHTRLIAYWQKSFDCLRKLAETEVEAFQAAMGKWVDLMMPSV